MQPLSCPALTNTQECVYSFHVDRAVNGSFAEGGPRNYATFSCVNDADHPREEFRGSLRRVCAPTRVCAPHRWWRAWANRRAFSFFRRRGSGDTGEKRSRRRSQGGARRRPILFDDRESAKNLATVETIARQLVIAGADRHAILVAVGGGVVGDVAGFAAATYLRGVRLVHVPTTLVAQVDSAIGGKTGVNLPEGRISSALLSAETGDRRSRRCCRRFRTANTAPAYTRW